MYIWHSKNTEESAVALATKLGCEHGTLPPQGYTGEVFCLGAAPAENFNWAARNFTKVINDPRKYRKYQKPEEVVNKVGAGSVVEPVRIFCVGGEIKKVVNTSNGAVIQTKPGVTLAIRELLVKLESPEVVALDGFLTKDGESFSLLRPVFGAALTEHDDVLTEAAKVAGPTPAEDKEAIQNLINNAAPDELRALRGLLSKLKAGA